jgi:hypothetical protein
MEINKAIQQLSDREVENIISHVTSELRDHLPDDDSRNAIQSQEEASAAITALLQNNGGEWRDPSLYPEDQPRRSRALLQLLLEDELLRSDIEALIVHPPGDSQRSADLAISAAVILGGLIAWLQTKIDIRVTRKDGKTDFHFQVLKNKTSGNIIKDVVSTVTNVFTGKP